MDLSRIWRGHRALWTATLVVIILIVGATLFAAYRADPRYSASSIVEVRPTAPEVSTTLLQFQMPSLEVRTIAPTLEEQVREYLLYSATSPKWTVSTHVTPGSGVMKITVESLDPRVPVPVANTYAKQLSGSDLSLRGIDIVTISPATTAHTTPVRAIILITGFGLAFVLPWLVVLWLGMRDDNGRSRGGGRPDENAESDDPVDGDQLDADGSTPLRKASESEEKTGQKDQLKKS